MAGTKGKTVLGLVEPVTVYGKKKNTKIVGRIDTGATRSSIDLTLAKELGLGPIVKHVLVKQASGRHRRPVVKVEIRLCGKRVKGEFTLADRSYMKYSALIGQDMLKKGFLIDPSKK